ncbi:MAG: rod shape-determining protein RodA, partial [Muribaculaceae bacterium]|nr:rod shape-determining protein RodA [Muribaculaceae bacterium]
MDTSRDNNESNKLLASVDWFTVLLYIILVVAGAISIYATTTNSLSQVSIFDFNTYSGKQFLWIGLSFVIGFALLLIDRRMYEGYAYLIYLIMIVILIATAFLA